MTSPWLIPLPPTLTQGTDKGPLRLGVHVRQDEPGHGPPVGPAEARVRDRRGAGRLGGGGLELVGCIRLGQVLRLRTRLRERHRAELHRRGDPALLRRCGPVVLPDLVPLPGPDLAAGPAAMRAGRAGALGQPFGGLGQTARMTIIPEHNDVNPVVAEVVRSGFTESRHRGAVAAVAADGRTVIGAGRSDVPFLPRSANK